VRRWNYVVTRWIALASLAALWVVVGCGRPPVVESDEAFSTVDALYTAITARKIELVTDVERRLKALHADGKLSKPAMQRLDAILAKARAGQWQAAAEQIDGFIRHQPPRKHSH